MMKSRRMSGEIHTYVDVINTCIGSVY